MILLMTTEAICFYAKKKGLGQATTYFARHSVKWFGNIVGLPNDCYLTYIIWFLNLTFYATKHLFCDLKIYLVDNPIILE